MMDHKIDFFMMTKVFQKSRPVILWLDDLRDPFAKCPEGDKTWIESVVGRTNPGNWDVAWVSNYKQFTNYVEYAGLPDVICFDHDLGETMTGKDCANYIVDILVERNLLGPVIRCQSSNPVGVRAITDLFANWRQEWLRRNPNENPFA